MPEDYYSNNSVRNQFRSLKGPYVVVFDSLIENDRKHFIVKELLAEYLMLEFDDKRVPMSLRGQSFDKSSLKLITPTGMPQQKNYVDCGLFLLQFAEIFMTNPPEVNFLINFIFYFVFYILEIFTFDSFSFLVSAISNQRQA